MAGTVSAGTVVVTTAASTAVTADSAGAAVVNVASPLASNPSVKSYPSL